MSYPASIVVPLLRQRDDWLERAVRSAVEQTVAAEVIVVVSDDTPPSNLAVLDRMGRDTSRLHVIGRPRPGFGAGLNAGIAAVTTPRVGFVLSDDWLDTDALEVCLPFDDDIVSAGLYGFSADGETFIPSISRVIHREAYERRETDAERADYLGHFLLLRVSSVERAGGLDETIGDSPGVDDLDLVWRMLERGASVGLPGRSVYNYRDHDGERLTLHDPAEMLATFERMLVSHGVTGAARETAIATHAPWFGRTVLSAQRELHGPDGRERERLGRW
ncbi:MAG: glycosyltransferase [Candidatus Limnocylindrales bacterium]